MPKLANPVRPLSLHLFLYIFLSIVNDIIKYITKYIFKHIFKIYNNDENWTRSHGNHSSNKFSNLKLINKNNIKNLEVAWIYSFENKGDIPGNPIYYDGRVYLSSTEKSLIALNAKNGQKITPGESYSRRKLLGQAMNSNSKSGAKH